MKMMDEADRKRMIQNLRNVEDEVDTAMRALVDAETYGDVPISPLSKAGATLTTMARYFSTIK